MNVRERERESAIPKLSNKRGREEKKRRKTKRSKSDG